MPEVMILQRNVLCARIEFGALYHFNGALVILPDGTEEIRIFVSDRKNFLDFSHEIEKW